MNALGVDVSRLDVPAFLAGGHHAYAALAVLWALLSVRLRRPGWLLAGIGLANTCAWLLTTYPLQQIYGLELSRDRVGNLGLCMVVAAGNSPLRTAQLGQLHFEPFWGALLAVLSGFDPDRLLALYPFLPLATAVGCALALYFGLEGSDWSAWERTLVAGFATLLSSAPLEYLGPYRVPWAMTFLLKPNHALGLVLFPLVLAAFVRGRGWRGRIVAGLLLHLLGWVFVLHMVYVAFGLVLFAALSLATRHADRRRDGVDVAVAIGINLLVVSPYLLMLFIGYPFLEPSPRMTIIASSPHLLETTARTGVLFALGVWGGSCAWRRQDRLGRLWATQVAGALLIWAGYLVLSALELARERDEIYYWTRFLLAGSAAIGAWDIAKRAAEASRRRFSEATLATLIVLAALPWSLPYWWDPSRMDANFRGSTAAIDAPRRQATEFLRRKTEGGAVVLADGDFARYAAALGARRVLLADFFHAPADAAKRARLRDAVLVDETDTAARELQRYFAPYAVPSWYMVATPRWLKAKGISLAALRGRSHLREAFFCGTEEGPFVAVFEVLPPAKGPQAVRRQAQGWSAGDSLFHTTDQPATLAAAVVRARALTPRARR